jgi:glycogen synthase
MKICLVSQEYPPETGGGGIGTQTYLKARGLSDRGHDVHVVSASWDRVARTYGDGKALIHRIPEPELGISGYEQSTYWLAYSTAVADKIHELSKEIQFDVIQFPEYGGEGFVYQTDTFRYRTARYVVQLHGPLAMFAEHMGWPDRNSTLHQIGCFMERTVIHHSDLVLASSHNTARFCAQTYDYPLDQINVIHSGIEIEKFLPRSQVPNGSHPRILFVGNIAGSKGIGSLVKAVLALKERYPKISLRAIGKGDGEFLQHLERMVDSAGAQNNVDFRGYVPYEELPEHYGWCDFFAGPSTYEPGPGNIYLEAMSCGRPVIACDTAGTPEVVLDQRTGLLVSPNNLDALINAIVELSDNKNVRERLAENGRQWIEENFSFEKYVDKVERLYKELVSL